MTRFPARNLASGSLFDGARSGAHRPGVLTTGVDTYVDPAAGGNEQCRRK